MAISYLAQADAAANTVALPGTEGVEWNPGDIAIAYAFNDSSTTTPSLPTGWTNIANSSGSTAAQRAGYRVLITGDTTIGTWTNATDVMVILLSGQSTGTPIGVSAIDALASTTMRWAALSGLQVDGSSWVVLMGGHRTATDTNTVALSGTTLRSPTNTGLALHTAEGVSTWAQTSKTVNANSTSRTIAVEVLAFLDVARLSQEPVEVVVLPDNASARLSQLAVEAVISIPRITVFHAFIITTPPSQYPGD